VVAPAIKFTTGRRASSVHATPIASVSLADPVAVNRIERMLCSVARGQPVWIPQQVRFPVGRCGDQLLNRGTDVQDVRTGVRRNSWACWKAP